MCGFHFFLIYICRQRDDCSNNGVRLDGFTSGKSEGRGLPHTKHKHGPALLPKETPGSVLKPVLDIIGQMEAEDPEFKAKAYFTAGEERCYTGEPIADTRFFPGWKYDASEPYVQKVKQRLDEIGICPELTAYNFCTNGSHYAGEAGIRTMGFGPSREDLAHTVDEYVEVDQLVAAMHGYIGIMEALFEEDDR